MFYAGESGRQVGRILDMNKANVYNWIKNETSNQHGVENSFKISEVSDFKPNLYELDELYWFIGEKPHTDAKENTYIITMVTRSYRTIAAHDIAQDKTSQRIQKHADSTILIWLYCESMPQDSDIPLSCESEYLLLFRNLP